ncbi:ATP-binding protein [Parvibaculum sp.]|uniref:AAA family ATPase n=1 Tax=Parvibaculum sp. TaxID=2024848 RepID=UPI00260317A4|nr:ATP-binding protein [Parvibaculum sp.]MCW5726247.1 tetratricopeptide repeat protein [Parvibaculum sp.]
MARTLKFNPGFQSDEEAISNFTVREAEFDTVIAVLDNPIDAKNSAAPRVLVVAPRGAGKTTLCRRVLAEVRRSPVLSERWQPIFLGEESYAVTTPGEFFLECLFQLRDQVPDADLDRAFAEASAATSEEELVQQTLRALRSHARQVGKRLLVIVENFHMILHHQLTDGGGQSPNDLLTALADDTLFGVLATSVTQTDDENQAALPSDYLRITLNPLTLEECRTLWTSLTGRGAKLERIRPLQILTGGSPRLLHILAEFMNTPSLQDLMDNLNFLIDQNTEYFKSQLDALPTIERKVFVALLDAWDPSTAKQVAESARVNTNVASAMLARLTDRGAVIKEPGRGRTAIYYASERLFNIYYLMRRRSHPSSRVRALVSFMTEYYDRDELIDTTAILVREACAIEPDRRGDYHSTFDAIMSASPEKVRDQILAVTPQDFIRSFRDDQRSRRGGGDYLSKQQPLDNKDENDKLNTLIERIEKAADEENFDLAQRLIEEGLESEPGQSELWIRLAFLRQRFGDFSAAADAATRAIELAPEEPWAHAVLGMALASLDRRTEARDAYVAALKIEPGQVLALNELAEMREEDGDVDGALELFESADQCGSLTDDTRARYGQLLRNAGRVVEAESVLQSGASDVQNFQTRRVLVEILDAADRSSEGIEILSAVATPDAPWEAWADLGTYLSVRSDDLSLAIKALETSIEKGADNPFPYRRLAAVMWESGAAESTVEAIAVEITNRFPELAAAWVAAARIYDELGQDQNVENSYREAIQREGGAFARVLLARHLQLNPQRRSEAENLLREAAAEAERRGICGPLKDLAELLIHNGEDKGAEDVIEKALEINDRCACSLILRGDICSRKGEAESAKNAYRVALDIDRSRIEALTGLARLVDRDEGEKLIAQAIESDPDDERALLARARLRQGDIEAQLNDTRAALVLKPDYTDALLFLATLEAARGEIETALEKIEVAMSKLSIQRELIPNFVSVAMTVAKLGGSEKLSQILDQHEFGSTVEPLRVALKLSRGEQPMVAKEVLEVAMDIVERGATRTE